MNVLALDTVGSVKTKIQDKVGFPLAEFRFLLAGKQLEDKRALFEYSVQGLSTLYLVSRLRGGMQTYDGTMRILPHSVGAQNSVGDPEVWHDVREQEEQNWGKEGGIICGRT